MTFVLHAPGPGVLHDAGDRDARLGIPAGWANTVGTIRSRSKQHVNVKRCWMLEDVGSRCYGNLWNVVGRCWEWMGMGDVRIRIWCHDMSWYVMICHDMSWSILVDSDGCLDTCQLLGGLGWYWNFCARMVSSCSREDSYHTYRNLSEQGWNLDCN